MSDAQSSHYTFDLADGHNRPNGGYLLGLTDYLFVYVLNGPDGMLQYAFIASRDPDDVRWWRRPQVGKLWDKVADVLRREHLSVHGSMSLYSGVRVEFHYPYLHILGKDPGSSEDDADIKFPPATYANIIRRIGTFANACTNADLAATLRMLASQQV